MIKPAISQPLLKRLSLGAFLLLAGFAYYSQQNRQFSQSHIINLYENKESGVMVEFEAEVLRLLSDDTIGIRHQRFIVQKYDLTVLISHNIDLAERVPIKKGDLVNIYGQYEWNDQGGVVHWTHDDPQGRHENGWIKLNGKSYGGDFQY